MILSEQFLRMQKLAGLTPANTAITLDEVLIELYLHEHYYSKGILKENISEGILDKIKSKFKDIKPTIKLVGVLKAKFNTLAKKLGIENPEESLKAIQSLSVDERTPEKIESILKQSSILKEAEKKEKINWRGLVLLAIYLTSFILKLTPAQASQVDEFSKLPDASKAAQELKIDSPPDDKTSDANINFNDALKQTASDLGTSDTTLDTIDDISSSVTTDTNPVSVDGKTIKVGFSTGNFTVTDEDGTAQDIADNILKQAGGKEIKSLKLGVKGLISNTPGTGDDDPNGPGKEGLGEKRLETAKNLAKKVSDIIKKQFPKAQIDIEDQGTNVTDPGPEVAKDSDEAKQNQVSSFSIADLQTVDDTEPTKPAKSGGPDLLSYLRNFKPAAPDGNKYYTILGQILPLLGPNGAFDYFYNNVKLEDGEVINDKWVDKQLKTVTDEDIKKVLLWARSIKKEPKALARELNKLDSNINLTFGDRKITKPGEKGQTMFRQGSGTTQTPVQSGPVAEHISLVNLLENIILEAQTDFNFIKGFDADIAKNNLGLLTPLVVYSWDVADTLKGKTKSSSIDYVSQNYKKSYREFEKNYPNITKIVSTNVTKLDTNKFDTKTKSVQTKADVKKVDTYLKNQPTLKRQIIKIDSTAEFENVLKDIVASLAEKNPQKFTPDTQKRILNTSKNRLPYINIKEVTNPKNVPSDAVNLSKLFKNNKKFQSLLKDINDEEEAIQFILRVILNFVSGNLDSNEIRTAFDRAKNSL